MTGVRAVVAANLRRLRTARRLTLDELAADSGVARATLARLESRRANPTIETLFALATALGTSLGELVEEGVPGVRVVRSDEGPQLTGSVDARVVDRLYGLGVAEVLEISFPAGHRRDADGHGPGVVEHLFVTRGRLEAGPVGETVLLRRGDYLRFPADGPHTYRAVGAPARAIVVMGHPSHSP